MSLINQMLQDLDARGQGVGGNAPIPTQVRPVASEKPSSRRVLVLGVLTVLVAVVGLADWLWQRKPAGSDVAPLVQLAQGMPPTVPSAPAIPLAAPESSTYGLKMSSDLTIPAGGIQSAARPPTSSSAQVKSLEKPSMAAASKAMSATSAAAPAPSARSAPPARTAEASAPRQASAARGGANGNRGRGVKEVSEQQRAENEYRGAVVLIQQGKTAEAMRSLEQSLYLDPLHGAARLTLVSLLIEVKQQNAAIRRLKEGLALEPSQTGMAMALARLQVEKGELRPGVEVLQRSLQYASDRPDYQAFLGALLQRQGRNKEAVEHYIVAVRLAPQSGIWWMGLGISLQADSRNAEAQESFTRAKATNSLSAELAGFVDQKLAQLRR